ncbi:MAG: histidine kinase [Burkholderiaceae bacterium]|nr:histidine kinase [Burkholderiaceae bacterium]
MVTATTDQPLRILHLEDSLADHQLASMTLRRAEIPCEFQHVDTLEAFKQIYERKSVDIILADYRLAGFTALDAWQYVLQQPEHPPFVLLSGAIGETAAVDAMRLGISDYLLKDDLARLPHVITRAIEVHDARRERERAVAELAISERRLADLTEHLQSSIEQERAAIAREIHDDIGGALTAVRFDIAWIGRHTGDPAMKDHATAAADMLQHAIGASQRIMMNLRPPILDQGLVAAVQWLARSFEGRTSVPTQVHASSEMSQASPEVQLVAYRTAQEALTNIAKYADPQHVRIDLSDSEGVLTLEVSDDGRGIEPSMRNKPKAFGLRGLQERARTVNGWLDISSQPGKGTSVILSVPLSLEEITKTGETL